MSQNLFNRKFFIRDLFNSQGFLTNNFHEIRFENLQALLNSVGNSFMSFGSQQKIIIDVNSLQDLKNINKLFEETKVNENQEFILRMENSFIIDNIELIAESERFSITTNISDNFDLFESLTLEKIRKRLNQDKFEFIVPVNNENYKRVFSLVLEIHNKRITRFFDFEVDYLSLENMKLSQVHELEFRYKDLNPWKSKTDKSGINDQLIINTSGSLLKRIYVSEDCKISLTKESYKDNEFVFDLKKNIDNTGETIEKTELNLIRQYIDMKRIFPNGLKIDNTRLINYYHNYKINGSIDELPLIFHIFLGE